MDYSDGLTLLANATIRTKLAEHYDIDVSSLDMLGNLTKEDLKRMSPSVIREYNHLCKLARRFGQET